MATTTHQTPTPDKRSLNVIFAEAVSRFLDKFRPTHEEFDRVTLYGLNPYMFTHEDYEYFNHALYLLGACPSEYRALMRLLFAVLDIDQLLSCAEAVGRHAEALETETINDFKARHAVEQ